MNKTRKRATQKHRAKAAKYEIRRKAEGNGAAHPKAAAAGMTAAARPKPASRRRDVDSE